MTGNNETMAPVIVFGYNREEHIKSCLESLSKCDGASATDVIVFSDGYKGEKDIDEVMPVRKCVNSPQYRECFGSYRVVERESNFGLAGSVITGVTETLDKYENVIVVEDDLILAKDFLLYMNGALEFYTDKENYGSISAYTYDLKGLDKYSKDVYVLRKGDCWGWATWREVWRNVDWELKDFDIYLNNKKARRSFSGLEFGLEAQLIAQHEGKLDAWAARWIFYLFNNNLLTVYPKVCRAINCGLDGSGVNCSDNDMSNKVLSDGTIGCVFEEMKVNTKLEKEIGKMGQVSLGRRLFNRLMWFLTINYSVLQDIRRTYRDRDDT